MQLGQWRYYSTYSVPQNWFEVNGLFYSLAALAWEKGESGTWAFLDTMEKRKISYLAGIEQRFFGHRLIAIPVEHFRLLQICE
jgi:hypothetical protein